ncbi:P-loop ATPase, Sll1717 family [uncultured Desulfobacter sp.]|uniref:P-loop ATPase, Sll1717 family n=1 Tax=uncultured Desulfobacter sp. TaxID=240139 RepID=UPI0029F57C6C|nr:hypothetical protein [uncultured Desulfobacter sp.]
MTRELLSEIEDWKLEAKLEDNQRYFYHLDLVSKIERGARSYVVGRKGTGKTAICEFLYHKKEHNKFSQKLTFKNFPFNTLYSLSNNQYNTPNQYITLWKYVIYSSIAKLLITNQNINSEIRSELSKVYEKDIPTSLSSNVSRWTSGNFNLTILGNGLGFTSNKNTENNDTQWIERVDILERLILEYLDNSRYMIIFDELDEDYKDIVVSERYSQYTALLTSLFKAVQDVRSVFKEARYQIFPVIFLRDDIYDMLLDPDKTKWNDLKVNLDWNEHSIKSLLAFRISKAISPNGNILPFSVAWDSLFLKKAVGFGHKQNKRTSIFNYITKSTQLRPRDYVRYLQVAAEETLHNPHWDKISPTTVVDVDKSFSNYLRSELEDEIHGVLPEIKRILDIFSKIRKQTLSIEEFSREFEKSIDGCNPI